MIFLYVSFPPGLVQPTTVSDASNEHLKLISWPQVASIRMMSYTGYSVSKAL